MQKKNKSKFALSKGKKIWKVMYNLFVLAMCVVFYRIVGCPIKALTGISCAGCGMTRALFAAGTGHIREAFHFHPLFWCVPIGILCFLLKTKLPKRFISGMQYVAITIFLIVYVFRLFDPQCEIVTVELTKGWIYAVLYRILFAIRMMRRL